MTCRIRTTLALAAAWALLSPSTRAAQVLYVTNQDSYTVSQINSAGTVTLFASSGLSEPQGLAFDKAGDLYVANAGTSTISEFSPTGAPLGTFASGLDDPMGLAFDAAGDLYVANYLAETIIEFSPTGAPLGTFASRLGGPAFLAFGPSVVPEPGSLTLAVIGAAALIGSGRLRRGGAAPAP